MVRLTPHWTSHEALVDTRSVGSELRIGIVHARWNTKIIDALLDGTKKALKDAGVKEENIVVQSVPGSYEMPYAVKQYVLAIPQLHTQESFVC
jgi:6,7-dimethyl-8-ribityllumazine synthase